MTVQFHFWEYVNRNQTFILDFHPTFICSVACHLGGLLEVFSQPFNLQLKGVLRVLYEGLHIVVVHTKHRHTIHLNI